MALQPVELQPLASEFVSPSVSAAVLNVWPNRKRHELSSDFYSLFLESEINFGGEGGLSAEQIWNGDFEALGREDWSTKGVIGQHDPASSHLSQTPVGDDLTDLSEPPPDESSFGPWRAVGDAEIAIVCDEGRNNSHALHIRSTGPESGAANPGYWGIGLRSGVSQVLRLHAKRAASPLRLRAQLVAFGTVLAEEALVATGEATHPGWQAYTATLRVGQMKRKTSSKAELRLLLPEGDEATIDLVSLVPQDAVAGLFRKDIFEALAALRPGMMRFPGGNYLEGTGPRTRWEWKRTVGPQRDRNGHFNVSEEERLSNPQGVLRLAARARNALPLRCPESLTNARLSACPSLSLPLCACSRPGDTS